MKNTIPVFLSSDNAYAPFVATTIASICDNTESFCGFYVLDGGITEENKQKIRNLEKIYKNFSLEFIKVDLNKYFPECVVNSHFSKSMYSRFLIPYLKPEINKALYSDVDVIFMDDIKKMYDESLDDYILAAVWEEFGENKRNKQRNGRLFIPLKHKYFSSGNLIIDCKKWRDNNIFDRLLEIEKQFREYLTAPDQDILNICFQSNYKILNPKYCYKNTDYKFYKKHDIIIRHFNGSVKPWHISPDMPENEKLFFTKDKGIFWKYAKTTDFYDVIKQMIKYKSFADLRKFLVYELLQNKINLLILVLLSLIFGGGAQHDRYDYSLKDLFRCALHFISLKHSRLLREVSA